MFLRGINYDVGTEFKKGTLSRPDFDETIIKKEIAIVKSELHCDAIKISGYDISRLSKASEFALEQGLQVWFAPSYIDATKEEAIRYYIDCAIAAEKLRSKYDNVIFVAGFESSLFLTGFEKGDTIYDRLATMFTAWNMILNKLGFRQSIHKNLNIFLNGVVGNVKAHFNGKLTYASGTWEKIDWSIFDFVGVDHYRAFFNKLSYAKELRGYYKFNRPVVVLEFGCCAYKGGDDKGPIGWAITEVIDGKQIIKGEPPVRDETVQANYITELLDIFKHEPIHGAFVFTFVNPRYKYNNDPKLDLDLASYGIVRPVEGKAYKGLPWVPKEAFYKLADYYSRM